LSRHISETFLRREGRRTYITSAAYLELVRSYGCLMGAKQEEIMDAKLKYLDGLNKLIFAAEQVRYFELAVIRIWCLLLRVMMGAGNRNNQHYSLTVPLLYSIYWLLHVSAVACHHQGVY
jgi:hypothetical protein